MVDSRRCMGPLDGVDSLDVGQDVSSGVADIGHQTAFVPPTNGPLLLLFQRICSLTLPALNVVLIPSTCS